MNTKQKPKTRGRFKYYDFLETFYISKREYKRLRRSREEEDRELYYDILNRFDAIVDNDRNSPSTYIYIKKRIIPRKIGEKIKFFPEILIERKLEDLEFGKYLELKRKEKNFNYLEYKTASSWLPLVKNKRGGEIFIPDYHFPNYNHQNENFSYDMLFLSEPKAACKTLKEAKKRLDGFLRARGIVLTN